MAHCRLHLNAASSRVDTRHRLRRWSSDEISERRWLWRQRRKTTPGTCGGRGGSPSLRLKKKILSIRLVAILEREGIRNHEPLGLRFMERMFAASVTLACNHDLMYQLNNSQCGANISPTRIPMFLFFIGTRDTRKHQKIMAISNCIRTSLRQTLYVEQC